MYVYESIVNKASPSCHSSFSGIYYAAMLITLLKSICFGLTQVIGKLQLELELELHLQLPLAEELRLIILTVKRKG